MRHPRARFGRHELELRAKEATCAWRVRSRTLLLRPAIGLWGDHGFAHPCDPESGMSIIERAAELLRSGPQVQQTRSAASAEGDKRRHDLIERAAQLAEATYPATGGVSSPPEPGKTHGPAHSSS